MRHYLGIMTGNSMDAVDVALADFSGGGAAIRASHSAPFPAALRDTLQALAGSDTINITALLQAQNDFTDLCAAAANALLATSGAKDNIHAIGCHGQTIAHRPAAAASWQLLSGARLAERTRCDVVCDFRARDLASGGQGAPLAPFFHRYFFARQAPCHIVNIGGIANITTLAADGSIASAYDTGPGMMLLDAWYQQHHSNSGYDKDASWAKQGSVNAPLLQALLAHPYLALPPPKSCGREEFSLALLEKSSTANLPPVDIQATLLEYTAHTIAAAVIAGGSHRVWLCGGGSATPYLVERLAALLPEAAPPQSTAAAGLPPQLVEAAAFAYLAKCHLSGEALAAAGITGGQTRIAGAHYPR